MAKFQKIPKHSRFDLQRPPLLAEPVDAALLARLGLPRYQPPAKGRSRKNNPSQPEAGAPKQPAVNPRPLAASPQPGSRPPVSPAPQRPGVSKPPAGQGKPPSVQPPAAPRQPLTGKPTPAAGPFNAASRPSPYEKRPPFNTSMPLRREPPAGGSPPGTPAPGVNQPGGSRPNSSAPADKDRQPPKPAPPVSEARQQPTKPAEEDSEAGKSKVPGAGQPEKPELNLRPGTQRPDEPRRPFSGAGAGQRPPVDRQGQSRLFHLPPLDYNFDEPAASTQPVDPDDDDLPEEKGGGRPEMARSESNLIARSELNSDEEEDEQPRSPLGRAAAPGQPPERRPETRATARPDPLSEIDTEQEPAPHAPGAVPRAETSSETKSGASFEPVPEIPSLRELLLNAGNLPSQTAILGVSIEDQLPVLLDLNDPAPGSLLVIGDERQQALELLRVAVSSVALRNTARGAQFIVFSHQPDTWVDWVDAMGFRRFCLGVLAAESNQAREWIYRLSEMAGQRSGESTGGERRSGPPVVVLLDTLSFMTRLQPDARQRLDNLIHSGPDVRIWSIAAVSTALAGTLGKQLEPFDTRIWGYSVDSSVYTRLSGVPRDEAQGFSVPGQFAVRVGPLDDQSWLKFRLPALDDLYV